MKRLFLITCILVWSCGLMRGDETKAAFLIRYSITGGFAEGTHYIFLVTDNEAATHDAQSVGKSDIYVIPKEAVSEFEALLAKQGINEWKSPPHGNAWDAFDTRLKVDGSKNHCDIVFARMPTQGAELYKQMEALVKELKTLASKRGRRIKAK